MKLTLVRCEELPDWYVIERAEHDGCEWLEEDGPGQGSLHRSARFSDNADVEGTSDEMRAIADAIERRTSVSYKRCAVAVYEDRIEFESPRNSRSPGVVSPAEAAGLAEEIRSKLDYRGLGDSGS